MPGTSRSNPKSSLHWPREGAETVVSAFATLVERLMLNQTNPDAGLGDLRSEYADGTNPHPFLTDPVVGRALSLAIDRHTLVRIGYGEIAGRRRATSGRLRRTSIGEQR